MVKSSPNFPVRGVPGGWRDAWSAPDDAAIAQAQFAAWAAARRQPDTSAPPTRVVRSAGTNEPTPSSSSGRVAGGGSDGEGPTP